MIEGIEPTIFGTPIRAADFTIAFGHPGKDETEREDYESHKRFHLLAAENCCMLQGTFNTEQIAYGVYGAREKEGFAPEADACTDALREWDALPNTLEVHAIKGVYEMSGIAYHFLITSMANPQVSLRINVDQVRVPTFTKMCDLWYHQITGHSLSPSVWSQSIRGLPRNDIHPHSTYEYQQEVLKELGEGIYSFHQRSMDRLRKEGVIPVAA